MGQKHFFQPETYEMVGEWRRLIDDYNTKKGGDPRVIFIEAWTNVDNTIQYYADSEGKPRAHFPFNFGLINELRANSTSTFSVMFVHSTTTKLTSFWSTSVTKRQQSMSIALEWILEINQRSFLPDQRLNMMLGNLTNDVWFKSDSKLFFFFRNIIKTLEFKLKAFDAIILTDTSSAAVVKISFFLFVTAAFRNFLM